MEKGIKAYNVRVYGILFSEERKLLVSREEMHGRSFTKFPGGGHEFGESLIDGLKREFMEELNIELDSVEHFYTTDFFQVSAFNSQEQLISVYYLVNSKQVNKIKDGMNAVDNPGNTFYWKKMSELNETSVTFPVDKLVLQKLKVEN